MDCSLPDSSVHGIFQARILEWVTVFYSRGYPWPRDLTHVSCISCIGRWIPYHYATWEALTSHTCTSNWSPPKQRCPFCMLRVLATRDYKGLRWWLPLPSIWELRSLNLSLWNGLHNFSLSERLLISPFELAEQFTSIIPLGSELHRLILHYVKITFLWSKHCHSFIWWDKVNHITPLVFLKILLSSFHISLSHLLLLLLFSESLKSRATCRIYFKSFFKKLNCWEFRIWHKLY